MSNMRTFKELLAGAKEKVKSSGPMRTAILAPSRSEHIEAAMKAISEGYIKPIFVGRKNDLIRLGSDSGFDIGGSEIVDSAKPAEEAISLATNGKIDLILNGGIPVREIAQAIGKKEIGFIPEGRIATHIAVFESSKYHKLMLVTDAACIPSPDAAQKIAIVENAAAFARLLGIPRAKAALLAAVEAIYPAVPVTMEAAAIAKMSERGQIKDVIIDGPLSFDCAISAEVAHQKGIKDSPVAGDADIFVTPTIETADGIYKAMAMFTKALAGGVIFGGQAPIATSYEVDSAENIMHSIGLAILASVK